MPAKRSSSHLGTKKPIKEAVQKRNFGSQKNEKKDYKVKEVLTDLTSELLFVMEMKAK